MVIGDCYTAPPQIAAHMDKDQKCSGTRFCAVEVNADEQSGVASCELCGFLVGVIDDGVAPRFDELLADSSERPFVVHLRFVKGANELRTVQYNFVDLGKAQQFARVIEGQFRSELSRNGATGFDIRITKDDEQIGPTKVFVI